MDSFLNKTKPDLHLSLSPSSLMTIKYSNELLVESDAESYHSFNYENETTLKPQITLKEWLYSLLQSTKYQVFIIAAVVLDTAIVIIELLLDLELKGTGSKIPEVLHCISLSLLGFFVLEIIVKLYAYRLLFFTHKGEVFDAIVIIIALILDAISLHSESAFAGAGLIIILRLWRVVRIQNSIVMSVHKRGEKKLLDEREKRRLLEQELEKCNENCTQLKSSCKELLQILRNNSIDIPSSLQFPEFD